jgi:hypothetical protein
MSIIPSPEVIVAGAKHTSNTAHPRVDVAAIHKVASIADNRMEPASIGTDVIDRHQVLYLSLHACNYDIFTD